MKEQKKIFASGNEMAAFAAADINYHVMGYYPISPSTEIAQTLDFMKVNGKHDINLIPADGEHSSAGICYGAAVAGSRVFNATSSNGLAFMLEQLPVFSGGRFPMVMNIVNRTISAPLNIHCDHTDLYLTLNLGWVILTGSNPQAVYDQNIIALKVAEHPEVSLPTIVSYDGYITSHQKHNVEVFKDNKDVRNFIGPKVMVPNKYINNIGNPVTVGAHMSSEFLIDNKKQLNDAMNKAMDVYVDVANEYYNATGRKYDVIEEYKTEDADTILFILNSAGEIAKDAVDKLRAEGKKVGIIRPNIIRPFPSEAIKNSIKGAKNLIIAERADNPGVESSYLSGDIKSMIQFNKIDINTQTLIYGLGGNDIFKEDFEKIFAEAENGFATEKKYFGTKPGGSKENTIIDRQVEYDSSAFKIGGFSYDFNEETNKLNVKIPSMRAFMKKPKRVTGGHSACPGCGIFPGVELFLKGIEGDVVMVNQTGCAYVVSANYPYSAHKGNYVHNLFQNGASTLSGAVEAILTLKDRGEIEFDDAATFVMLSGDGGMDIGMGSAIGAALRNHKMIVLEYDNEGYMNTGAQLSYSTPIGHRTSTSNVGPLSAGKEFDHKDTVQIMAATNIPYVFTGVDAYPQDLVKKAAKAHWYAQKHGFVYGKILISCPLNWKSADKDGSILLEAAVNSNFFPLYEIENGITNITYSPEESGAKVDVEEWLKLMGKSKHLLLPGNKNVLDHFKAVIDKRWSKLIAKNEHPEL